MNFLPHDYGSLLFGAMTVNLFMVMSSTVIGAFLVEAGQSMGATGRLTALRMLVIELSAASFRALRRVVVNGWIHVGHWGERGSRSHDLPHCLHFPEGAACRSKPKQRGFSQRQPAVENHPRVERPLDGASVHAPLHFSPGFSTPLFYRQTDELHFSKQAIGNLGSLAAPSRFWRPSSTAS